jgi:cytidylate kinase
MKHDGLPAAIAIDGPAASGKSTVGQTLAARHGYRFLDTGLMYRAFTLAALRAGVAASDPGACTALAETIAMTVAAGTETRIFLDAEDVTDRLRDADVEANVSAYSAIAAVREVMVRRQRAIAAEGRAVLAGRDIGTVVLPGAGLKIYLDASEEARARRRGLQAADTRLASANVTERDRIDSGRTTSPLRPAEDAVVIDTTDLTLDEVLDRVEKELRCASS